MRSRTRILASSILIMAVALLATCTIAIMILYHTAFEQHSDALKEMARVEARLVEAFVTHDTLHHQAGHPFGSVRDDMLHQIGEARKDYPGFGRTGEFVFGQREGDHIYFLFPHRHGDGSDPDPVRWKSDLATPMRLALSGQAGTVIGLDYRGERVLAAYQPIQGSDLGCVAKLDVAEIHAPFIKAALLTGGATLCLVLFGSVLMLRICSPLIRQLGIFQRFAEESRHALAMADLDFRITYINPELCRLLGVEKPEDVLGKTFVQYYPEELRQRLEDEVMPTVMRDGQWKGELAILSAGDEPTPTIENMFLIRDDKKRPLHLANVVTDITERKKMEKELRESEHRYRKLFQSSRDAIMTLAPPSWEFTSGNPATVEMFATKDEAEFISLGPWEVSPEMQPDGHPSAEKAKEMIETAMREGSHFFEWTHKRLSGEEFPATISLTRMELAGESLLLATVRDISAQKQSEADLEMFRQFAEASGQGLGWADLEGRILYVNEALCRMFCEDRREDVIGKDLAEYYDEDTRQRLAEEIFPVVLRDGQWVGELDIHNSKGKVVPTFNNLFAIRDKDDAPLCYANVLTDITERKQSEERIARESAKLASMITGMEEGVVFANADDIITEVNTWFLSKTGLKREAVLGKSLWEFHPNTEVSARVRDVLDQFRSGQQRETYTVERELLGMHLSLRAQPVFQGNCYRGAVLNVINVSDLVKARQAAEAANRSKSEFLANMSHEIRTPMTAILGFADVLLEQGNIENAPPERIEAANTIKRNGEYLLGIINDILDLSKIEAGKMTVERVACSPCQLVAEVTSLVRVRANAKGLPLEIEYAGPIPETIENDPTRLRQVLINLIGNAIKFTEVGEVRLVTRFVDGDRGPSLQFDVVDTGLGMSEEQVAKLFRPFVQADTSTTRKFGGTGLGLVISKRLAELLGGDVAVAETREGAGTRMRVTVPTGPLDGVKMVQDPITATVLTPDEGSAKASVDKAALHGCRILLAEDAPDNQRLIAHLLRKAGADVTVVDNGKLAAEAALAAHDESPGAPGFDVILMDMQMPVMDGYEATGLLRQKGYDGPIIALTAHSMASDREKCIKAGCDDYVTKPVRRDMLINTINAILIPSTIA